MLKCRTKEAVMLQGDITCLLIPIVLAFQGHFCAKNNDITCIFIPIALAFQGHYMPKNNVQLIPSPVKTNHSALTSNLH